MRQNDTTIFRGFLGSLQASHRDRLISAARRRVLGRGETLYTAGEDAQHLHLLSRGVIALSDGGERRAGDLVGEAAFLSGTPHRQAAVATRDCELLELDRDAYRSLLESLPALAGELVRATSSGLLGVRATNRPRVPTVAIVPAGHEEMPAEFFARLARTLPAAGMRVVDRDAVTDRFGRRSPEDAEVTAWLDELEHGDKVLAYLGEPGLTDWTRICLERCDQVVMATTGEAPVGALSPMERLAAELFPASRRRLVRLHPCRQGVVSGTAGWLARMEVAIHHHVSIEDDADLLALGRFLTGQAVGFVAGGGGGYGPAHVGIYRAFREQGVTFDAFVGTSVGSAMLAGFALLGEYDTLTAGTEDIFVKSRSFKRPTLPRYSLLDHKVFDEALARAYGSTTMVEDCWKPFCAIATNLSAQRIELIRTGLLWQAVRASSAIPCILPPFYTKDGTMLVDGGLMDDAPLVPMKSLKDGPNLVVHFGRSGESRFDVDYEALPGRGKLLTSLINPRARLPRAPKIMNVLFRSLLAHQRYDLPIGTQDLVLTPPSLPGASLMSFDRHMEVFNAAHLWGKKEIEQRSSAADPAMLAIMSGASTPAGAQALGRAA